MTLDPWWLLPFALGMVAGMVVVLVMGLLAFHTVQDGEEGGGEGEGEGEGEEYDEMDMELAMDRESWLRTKKGWRTHDPEEDRRGTVRR